MSHKTKSQSTRATVELSISLLPTLTVLDSMISLERKPDDPWTTLELPTKSLSTRTSKGTKAINKSFQLLKNTWTKEIWQKSKCTKTKYTPFPNSYDIFFFHFLLSNVNSSVCVFVAFDEHSGWGVTGVWNVGLVAFESG